MHKETWTIQPVCTDADRTGGLGSSSIPKRSWLGLIANHVISFFPEHIHFSKEANIFLVVLGTLIHMLLILFMCRSKSWVQPSNEQTYIVRVSNKE